jgi:DNA-binding PadR family transcriptional regulator
MATCHPEWRILRELAEQPAATPELRARLRKDQPVSSYVLTTRLGLLRALGWLKGERSVGQRRSVMIYTLTARGLRALRVAQQRGYATMPLALAQEIQDQEPDDAPTAS